jgi:hypothetical protein
VERVNQHWPVTEPDAVARLHALAAAIRGASVTEGVVDAPYARVWAHIADLEQGFGDFEPDMRRFTVLANENGRVEALAVSRYGMRARLRGTLRPGWCWLQSRFLLIGVAAVPDGPERTRVAFTGGVRVPGRAALIPLGVKQSGRRALRLLQRRMEG